MTPETSGPELVGRKTQVLSMSKLDEVATPIAIYVAFGLASALPAGARSAMIRAVDALPSSVKVVEQEEGSSRRELFDGQIRTYIGEKYRLYSRPRRAQLAIVWETTYTPGGQEIVSSHLVEKTPTGEEKLVDEGEVSASARLNRWSPRRSIYTREENIWE